MGILYLCTFVCLGALGLNSICGFGDWGLECVCVFWVKLWSVLSEHFHSSIPGCCGAPAQSREGNDPRGKSQTSWALCLSSWREGQCAGSLWDTAGINDLFSQRALVCGLKLNFGFALWTLCWAVGTGSTWDTPPAPLSGPAQFLLKLQQAASNCTISLAPQGLNSPLFAEKINILRSQYDYNLCWHRTGSVLVPAASRLSGKAGLCNSSQSKAERARLISRRMSLPPSKCVFKQHLGVIYAALWHWYHLFIIISMNEVIMKKMF